MPKPIFSAKKILIINPFPVFPPISGGQSRVFHLYKYIAAYCNVVILCFADIRGIKEISPKLRQIMIPKSPAHIQSEIKLFHDLGTYTCAFMPMVSQFTPEFVHVLKSQATDADILILSHPYLYNEVQKLGSAIPLIYDAHNVEFQLHQQILPSCLTKLLAEIHQVEKSACEQSRLILTCSQQDAGTLASLYSINPSKFLVVPNGVDSSTIPFISRSECARNKKINNIFQPLVVFIGGYHPPNLEAAKQVIEMAQQLPAIQFLLLGDQCRAFQYPQLPSNVKLCGVVGEQEKNRLFSLADIALNPMLSGSGTNIKMFDYMAAGLPVITTAFGARGINGINGKHFIICQPPDMPSQILELLNNVPKMEYLAEQAFSLVINNYDWRNIADNLIAKLSISLPR